MCGIAGMATLGGALDADAPTVVARMSDTLAHRGPDASGQWSDDLVAFGHRRLAIIDLSDAGAQPMLTASDELVITFNGEIYNFEALAQRLEAGGWQRRSGSDTEVLLAAIDAWGIEGALDAVDGMFAFALYDRRRQTLTLARDRFGEKPLAYAVQDGTLWFASEVRAFDVPGGPELLLDPDATAAYFRYGWIPGPATIYAGVGRVPPASTVTFHLSPGAASGAGEGRGGGVVQRYWEVPSGPVASGDDDVPGARDDEILEVLRTSVRDRLVSDRPLGAFLSGGIDSSLTCALAAEASSGPLRTFTMVWDDAEFDESKQAALVASAIGADHTEVSLSFADAVATAEDIGSVLDEPHADYSVIGVNLVARSVRRDLVVALSGDGGDELFGGYNRYVWLPRAERARRRVPSRLRLPAARALGAAGPAIERLARPIPVSRRPRILADKAAKLSRALAATGNLDAYDTVLCADGARPGALGLPPAVEAAVASDDPAQVLWGLRAADLTRYLPDDVLTKVDRATMAVSLESRTPFLHADLARIAMGMGPAQLWDGAAGKRPLRSLLGRLVPSVDFSSPKTGFGTPIAALLRGPLADLAAECVASFTRRPLPPGVAGIDGERRLRRLVDGDDAEAPRVWAVVAFELWAARRTHDIVWA